jgi:hypothetical protein
MLGGRSALTSTVTSVKLDGHLVAADLLDRIAKADLPAVDAHLRDAPDLVGTS